MWIGTAVEHNHSSVRGNCDPCARFMMSTVFEIVAAVQALPAIALKVFGVKKTPLTLIYVFGYVVLIALASLPGNIYALVGEPLPQPSKLVGIEPHHTGIDYAHRLLKVFEIFDPPKQ